MKTNNPANGIRGVLIGAEPADERDHFYTCVACGQSVDKRDLGEVFHHEEPNHEPLRRDA